LKITVFINWLRPRLARW